MGRDCSSVYSKWPADSGHVTSGAVTDTRMRRLRLNVRKSSARRRHEPFFRMRRASERREIYTEKERRAETERNRERLLLSAGARQARHSIPGRERRQQQQEQQWWWWKLAADAASQHHFLTSLSTSSTTLQPWGGHHRQPSSQRQISFLRWLRTVAIMHKEFHVVSLYAGICTCYFVPKSFLVEYHIIHSSQLLYFIDIKRHNANLPAVSGVRAAGLWRQQRALRIIRFSCRTFTSISNIVPACGSFVILYI